MDKELRIQELENELAKSRNEVNHLTNQLNGNKKDLPFELYQYKSLIHSSPSMITLLKGEDLIIQIANDPILEFWGKDTDIIGKPITEAHPDIKDGELENLLKKVFRTGKAERGYEMPVYITRGDKKDLCYFNFVYQPQKDESGNIYGVAVIAHEVSPQAKLHQKLKESEQNYRQIANFMPHKISIADKNGDGFFYNKSWIDYTGWTLEEFREKSWVNFTHPEHSELITKTVEENIPKGKDIELELKIRDKQGRYNWHLCRANAIKNENGEVISWISSSTEIQKLKQEEQRKEDFLKLVSHELKTPVTSIKGYVQLMQRILDGDKITAVQPMKPYLNRIEDQVERLIRLISEMLDLSRIEKNELELHKENFSLNELVEQIVEDLSFTQKDIQISISHECDCTLEGDKDRIGQVIINFINNAVKYSPDNKKVEVRVFNSEKGRVAVSVKDYGIGIKEEDLGKVFRRFYRASGKNEETYSGFGIGLFLSSEIIERHEGTISAKSDLGKGSTFTFTLPLNQK